ncbi:MAG: carboxylesterase family protein, partial [Proteobacteria bacterium]|nr:carboxylesterase family protein [Pseudomonadota bacterium]
GWNVQSLLISPLAAGLFHGAVSQSGPSTNVKPVAYVEKNGGKVVQQLLENDRTTKEQVGNLAEYLRKKTLVEIFKVFTQGVSKETKMMKDGTVLKATVNEAFKSGNYNKVPVILGSNKEEAKFFIGLVIPPYNKYWMRAFWVGGMKIDAFDFKDLDRQLSEHYRTPVDSRKFYEDLSRYGSPLWTVICVDQLARNLRRHDDQPGVYAYLFKWGG